MIRKLIQKLIRSELEHYLENLKKEDLNAYETLTIKREENFFKLLKTSYKMEMCLRFN